MINFKDLFNIRHVDTKNKKIIDKNFKLLINDKNKYFYQNYIQNNIEQMNICEKIIKFNFCSKIFKEDEKKYIKIKYPNVDINKIIIISSYKEDNTFSLYEEDNTSSLYEEDNTSLMNIEFFIIYNSYMSILNILNILSIFRKKNKIINIDKQKYFCKIYNEIYTELMKISRRN